MIHDDNPVTQMDEVNSVSRKNPGLLLAYSIKDLLENVLSDSCVECRNGVIHQQEVSVCVNRSCKTNSRFLSSGKVNTLFTDLGLISTW